VVGEIPAKFKNTSQSFSTFVALTSHKKQTESGTEVLQTEAESKYKYVHTELVQVSMILKMDQLMGFWI
jgi:hypothetical protein